MEVRRKAWVVQDDKDAQQVRDEIGGIVVWLASFVLPCVNLV
jgi:hypothetical protein